MNKRNAGYWVTTVMTAFVFLSGGAAYLARADFAVPGIVELGYPVYLVTILGIWKVLGSVAIVAPRFPRLKEWAYAGFAFDLTGAAASHAAVGHPPVKVIVPLVILGVVMASWALRPVDRVLGSRTRDRPSTPNHGHRAAHTEA